MQRMGTPVVLALALVLAVPAAAQDMVLVEYYQGHYQFDYQQWPFGGYGGSFDATGEILDPDTGWADGQTESVGGRMELLSDTLTVWAYGAILNADETVDLAAVFVRTDGETLNPGTYPVDTEDFMALYAFFDDVVDFQIPEGGGDMAEWLAGVQADQTFFATSGSITLTQVDETRLAGSFTGLMADPNDFTIVSVDNAAFDLDGQEVTSAPGTPALARHGCYPNPFNPKTTLRFALAAPGTVKISVHDGAGRRVRSLHAGAALSAGEHEIAWDGRDDAGRALPSGVYHYRVETALGTAAGKMILLK